jgi:hypothetical protein
VALGPIEVVVVAFPGNRFNGRLVPELRRLIDADTISVIDGLFARKHADGSTTFIELDEMDANDDAAGLVGLLDRCDGLLADEDVTALTEQLGPNSSAAILVFEHTWMKPIRDAVVDSGGVLAANFRVPGAVVQDVLASMAELN